MAPDASLHGAVPSHFTEIPFWMLSRGYHDTPGGHVRIYAPRVLIRCLREAGIRVTGIRYVHFVDSLFWLRFCIADRLQPARPKSDFEAAVMIAVARERPVASWRQRLRRAISTSRLIAAVDTAGALIWPKSLTFVARKAAAPTAAIERTKTHVHSR
jgi:hypothetical protein